MANIDEHNDRVGELIHAHIDFAARLARQFYWERAQSGIDLEDIEGAAFLGLCDAARRFDREKGSKFRTYAYFRVRGAMFDLMRHGSGISRTYFNDLITHSTAEENGRESGSQQAKGELPERTLPYAFARTVSELGSLVEVIKEAGIRLHTCPDGAHSELSYAHAIDPETAAQLSHSYHYLRKLIRRLPDRERQVIEFRYFEEENYDQIRARFDNVSKSWVSRVHGRAIDLLREMARQDGITGDAVCP